MQIPELIPGIEPHNELNPALWHNDHLKDTVQSALLEIAEEFFEYLNIDVKIHDVIVTGSQAGYNYTSHSDLDLHIIVEYDSIECDHPVDELLDTKRKLWKQNHNITIHGIPVECYAEDTAKPVTGSSYSLLTHDWVTQPQVANHAIPKNIKRVTQSWYLVIEDAIASGDVDRLHRVKKTLMKYRQTSLKAGGEMSRGNIVFKTLRNMGAIAQLMRTINHLEDQALSLPD